MTHDDRRLAVIGLAFRFPGADTREEFWRVIRDGRDCVTRFTPGELAAAGIPAEQYRAPDFVGASGLLDGIAGFDAEHFRMSAREAQLTDPQHRLFLECAQHALEDAGYPDERDGTRVGVWASTGYQLYSLHTYLLNNVLPAGTGEDWLSRMQAMVGNHPDFTASRAAYRLGLTGPAVGVQSACSSSLVAVQLAAQSVLSGDCDLALAGATAVHVPQVLGYRYVKGSILSKSGRLRAFDAGADGTVGGTGVVAVVLKRLTRALADGDTVHGVILGWGIGNDGAGKQAFTAPTAQGQHHAIRQALRRAGAGAESIGYLETHGTGTLKGDPIEFDGATRAYRQDTDRTGYCALGSVKANIGHLDAASGLAGLVKTLLVLRHGVIPPLANFRTPNPLLELDTSPFYIPTAARPWPEGDTPRRAGLTSLGVGGTNVHLVLEQAPEPAPRAAALPPPDVLLVSGSSPAALTANATAFRDRLRQRPGTHPADLVTTAALGRTHGRHRLAVRGAGPTALARALDTWLAGGTPGTPPPDGPPRTAFLYSGQAGPHPGMARALHERFPVVREVLDRCAHLFHDLTGTTTLLPALLTEPGPGADPCWDTDLAQPALYALQCALTELWREAGLTPDMVTAHSVGEYAALYAAGALSLADGLRLTTERGRLMQRRCAPGGMVAVAADRRTALRLAEEVPGLEPAVTNGTRAQVLAGPPAALDRLRALLDRRGIPARPLPVTRAFHTALMEPMLAEFRTVLDEISWRPAVLPLVSGMDGLLREPGWIPDTGHLLRHTRRPVRFDLALAAVGARRPTALVEIGPHHTLSGLARQALGENPGETLGEPPALPSLRRGTGLDALWAAAAALHRVGADLDWRPLLAGSGGRRIALPGYRFQHKDHWTGPRPMAPRTVTPAREGTVVERREATVEHILHSIVESTARHLGHDPRAITGGMSFFDLGADSLQMINVLRELEERHRVKISMRELFEETGTPRQLAELIADRVPGDADGGAGSPVPVAPPGEPDAQLTGPAGLLGAPSGLGAGPARLPGGPVAAPAAPGPPPLTGHPVAPQPPAAARPPADPVDTTAYATREELADLAEKLRQISRIQLQMMSQLSQLLSLQAASATERLHGTVTR
ncbi:type I polyketide synthase [Streptomyces sp. NPDC052396]|uniref:type I polyketide synthase n=1 Tax=Streptomyces sp. NPDC052396 TaxID=3365689 RepID=UPI0037D167CB